MYRAETEGAVFTRFDVTSVGDTASRHHPRGVPCVFVLVKAATYHRLRIDQEDGAFVATVVLDV